MTVGTQPVRREEQTAIYAARHLRFGLWSLFVFTALGLVLEALHAFKVPAYLDVDNDTRRLMWTLAHAHGTLLALVHIAYGLGLRAGIVDDSRRLRPTSLLFAAATILLPAGFFLGGLRFYSGDPGVGVALVPFGALALLVALAYAALSVVKPETGASRRSPAGRIPGA